MPKRPFPLHTGFAEVVRLAQVTPQMRRITFAAPEFGPGFGVEQPGEIVTLGWAEEGEELVLPELGWRFPAGKREQHWRNYTVRGHRPELAEVDIDFYLHGDLGRASAWAERGRLAEAVRELGGGDGGRPWRRAHAWGGGESQAMREVRDELRRRRGVKTVQVLGYWSRNLR